MRERTVNLREEHINTGEKYHKYSHQYPHPESYEIQIPISVIFFGSQEYGRLTVDLQSMIVSDRYTGRHFREGRLLSGHIPLVRLHGCELRLLGCPVRILNIIPFLLAQAIRFLDIGTTLTRGERKIWFRDGGILRLER